MTGLVNFRIQLLSGKNVVLAEAEGYESEIFMPHIVNGRITFLNVIPNRRCCFMRPSSKHETHKATAAVKSEQLTPALASSHKSSRIPAGRDKENCPHMSPLAMSTPACPGKHHHSNKSKAGDSISSSVDGASFYPTPDVARKDAGKRNDVLMDISTFNLPRGLKVMRLYSGNNEDTPRKMTRIVSPSKDDEENTNTDSLNMSGVKDLSTNFKANSIPLMYNTYTNELVSSTSTQKSNNRSQTKVTSGKWHKVRTPKKTYSRRGNHAIPKHDKSLTAPVSSVKPSYLVNPTMAPKSTYAVDIKKRHVKVDDHTQIPSKIIKKRQNKNNKVSEYLSNTTQLQRSLNHIGNQAVSAFNLLTNSNRADQMTDKLNQQFRKGCLNKASSTYQKYKALSTVPPLKEDEQVLEMTGKQITQSKTSAVISERNGSPIKKTKSTSQSLPVHKTVVPKKSEGVSASAGQHEFVKPKIPILKADSKRSVKISKKTTV